MTIDEKFKETVHKTLSQNVEYYHCATCEKVYLDKDKTMSCLEMYDREHRDYVMQTIDLTSGYCNNCFTIAMEDYRTRKNGLQTRS